MPFPHPPDTAVTSRRRKKLLSAFTSAFRTPDLRKKIFFTVAMIVCLDHEIGSFRQEVAGALGEEARHLAGRPTAESAKLFAID